MPQIVLATLIRAAPAVCFDLARDAQLHLESARPTGERIVAGRDVGLWELGDEITFEGVHLGVRQRFSARVVEFERPDYFSRPDDARRLCQHEPRPYFSGVARPSHAHDRRFAMARAAGKLGAMVSDHLVKRICGDFCVRERGI